MKKVRATSASTDLRVEIKELHRLALPGEEFEVSDDRFEVLRGNNRFKAVFVSEIEQEPEPEFVPVHKRKK